MQQLKNHFDYTDLSDSVQSIKESTYPALVRNFDDVKDTIAAPNRAKIYSYHPGAKNPIIFRHYHHMLSDPKELANHPKHKRNYLTIFIFVECKMSMLINDTVYSPACGDVLLIGTGDTFQPLFFTQDNIDYYEINLPSEIFEFIQNDSPFHNLFYPKEKESCNFATVSQDDLTDLFHILHRLDSLAGNDENFRDFMLYSYLLRLMTFLCNQFANSFTSQSARKLPPALHKAMQYVSQNYLTVSDIVEIAGHCHVSVSYLCRVFKKYLEITPTEFINSRKLAHAKFLLKKGYSVTDACFGSGFNSYNYFIATFKKNFGMTPTKYKNSEFERK
ncbi:MAG: helix-turn-helix transcriptional regulator [Clostridia bacterium]|nr:helix-turn-helix transcriptional regulator [Clostridia bacterium]